MKNILQFIIRNRAILIDAAVLFGLMILFFSRWIFYDHYLLFASDIIQDFVTHRFAAFAWSQGMIPLWDPYFFWAAIGYFNSGFFYPFNLLVDLLQIFTYPDLNESYLLMQSNIFFHFFLASFFMYLLVRQFTTSRIVAIIAGIIFAYSGYMVKGYLHYNYIQSAPWLPLFFLFFYKSVFDKKNWLIYSILTGIVFTVSILPGQTQPAIYFLLLILIFTSYASYYFLKINEKKMAIRSIISLFIVILVTFGLFAIQFFPTYEYKKYTPRESIEYSYSIGYSTDPLYFVIHSFVPSFWGTMQSKFWDGLSLETLPSTDQPKWLDRLFGGLPNEMTFYLGLLPFFLLPFAFLTKNKFLRNLLFILLFASVLLMLARSMPLIGRLYWIILGGIARVPARAAILWSFSLAFLCALGLQVILDWKEKKELFEKIIKINFIILSALVFIFFPILLILLLSQAGQPSMVFFFFPLLNGFSLFLIYFLIYSILIFALIKANDKKLLLFLITLFTVVDIFSFHMGNTYLLGSPPEKTLGTSRYPDIGYLQKDNSYFRVQGLKMAAYANQLYSLGYGTTGSYGFAYRPMMELYNSIPNASSPIYDLLNVKYFYTSDGTLGEFNFSNSSSSELKKEISSSKIKRISDNLYLNTDYFPRAFAVYNYLYFKDRKEMLQAMLNDKNGTQMRQSVFLNTRPPRFKNPTVLPQEESIVKIKKYSLQEIVIEANMKANGFLVLSDVWYPGWTAKVDGQPTPVYQADYALRAVQVKEGKHKVIFQFESQPAKLGFIITITTIFILLTYFFYLIFKVKLRK